MEDLCERLKSLATDNNKHQTKKDRKQQRSSFRDVLSAVEVKSPAITPPQFSHVCVLPVSLQAFIPLYSAHSPSVGF